VSDKRHQSDILPFLPTFRHLFRNLPTQSDGMTLKVCRVPLADVECVTNTLAKVGGPIWYLNIKKGKWNCEKKKIFRMVINVFAEALKFGNKELSKYCASWEDSTWDELDWARVKELQVREILNQRQAQAAIAQSCQCLSCPDFLKHVSSLHSMNTYLLKLTHLPV
jgi:antiviral helicase SKI2